MFSGFWFWNLNADPAQAVRGKRPNENVYSHHDEIEEPPKKMERFELDDSDDEWSVCLPPDLENFVRKYMKKYAGDNTPYNPAPGNVDTPQAPHFGYLHQWTDKGNCYRK